jgi:hypothetical protein
MKLCKAQEEGAEEVESEEEEEAPPSDYDADGVLTTSLTSLSELRLISRPQAERAHQQRQAGPVHGTRALLQGIPPLQQQQWRRRQQQQEPRQEFGAADEAEHAGYAAETTQQDMLGQQDADVDGPEDDSPGQSPIAVPNPGPLRPGAQHHMPLGCCQK